MNCYENYVFHRLIKKTRLRLTVKNIPCANETKETVRNANVNLKITEGKYKSARNADKNTG